MPSDSARDIPDLSLFAGNGFNYSFYVMCQMDANASDGGSSTSCNLNAPYLDFQAAGGTSAAVQTFAGIMALVNQKTGERQGNANYVLYPMAATAASNGTSCNSSTAPVTNSSCIFYDVTVGNNSVICQGGTPNCSNTSAASGQYGIMVSNGSPAYPTTAGYDLATGLGTVNVANLVNHWTSNFAPSTTSLSLSTTPTTTPISLTHGQPINFNITVTSGSGTPTGDVLLIAQTGASASNAPGIGPFTLSGGSVSGSTIMLPGGSYNVTAHYAGNGTFAASDSSPGIPVTVGKESSQTEIRLVTLGNPTLPGYNITTVPYGSPYVLRMDVTNSSGNLCAPSNSSGYQYSISYPCPTGSLTVSPAPTEQNPPPGTVPGSYTLNSQGYAEDQPIQLSPGTYPFVATYAGDNSFTASTSLPTPITITPAPTTVTASMFSCETPIQYGLPCQINALINTTSSGISPSGTVTFFVNGAQQGSPVPVFNSGLPNPSGNTPYAWAQGSDNLQFLTIGTNTFSAEYSGDTNYQAAASAPVNITVAQNNGGVSVFTGPPIQLGQQAALQAQALGAPPPAAAPTGTITFYDGGNAIGGSVTYSVNNGSLFASLSYTPTTGGYHLITASYSGDSYYASSTSSSATLTVQSPSFWISGEVPGDAQPGQSVTGTVTVSPIDGFTGTVNLTCAVTGMPVSPQDMPTCSLNPASVTVGANGVSVIVTLNTVAPSFVPPAGPGGWPMELGIVMLGLAALAAGLSRRRAWRREAAYMAGLAAILLAVALWASCGGGGGGGGSAPPRDPGTRPGNYTVTVVGTSGSLTQSMTWTLSVRSLEG